MGIDVQAGKIVWGVDAAGTPVRLLVTSDGKVVIDGTIIISDVTKVPNSHYLAPTALDAGETATIWTPAAGKKVRLKRIQISVDAATRVDLRWAATAFESYYLPASGSVVVNFIATNHEGAANENLTLLSSAAATVTASASGDEI